MTDPIPVPDDDIAATRARIAAQAEEALEQLRRLESESHSALLALGEVAQERDRMKAQLAEWEQLRNIVAGADGPDDIAQWIMVREPVTELLAVAEAAKALAADEGWTLGSDGKWYDGHNEDSEGRVALAEALLDLGPQWDWRSK